MKRLNAESAEPLLVIVGPTASGKTALAVELARELGGEVISADSVQVYRQFDIGTGKADVASRARVPHHLIDILEPSEGLDAAGFVERAEACMAEIRGRGKLPIVCGGTFLWVRALLYGLAGAPAGDPALRRQHQELAQRAGRAALHAELGAVDPASAERLNPNDFVRVSRALEVFQLSQKPLSVWQAEHGFRTPRHAARLLGVARTPAELDELIAGRVEQMFRQGFVAEVRRLLRHGHGGARAMGSVGYRQIAEALATGTEIDGAELTQKVVRATRVFARRQRTWLRDQPVEWVSAQGAADLAKTFAAVGRAD